MAEDDDELVAAIVRGDEWAEERFDKRFRLWIEGIARKRGVPECDRSDVVQDALFEAIRQLRLGAFQHRSALSSWVYTIASGRTIDQMRRHRRVVLVGLEALAVDDA